MSAEAAARRRRQKADKLRNQKLGTYTPPASGCEQCTHQRMIHRDDLWCLRVGCECEQYVEAG